MPAPVVPKIRKRKFRGQTMWEIDCRARAETMRLHDLPLRVRKASKAEAEAWAAHVVETTSREPTGPRNEVRDLCDAYLESKRLEGLSERMIKNYRSRLRRLVGFLDEIGVRYTHEVSRGVVADYQDYLLRAGLERRTAAHYVTVGGGCFSWAVKRDILEFNPFSGMAYRTSPAERRMLTDEERESILSDSVEGRHVWAFLLATGLRRIELCRANQDNLHLDSPAPHADVLGKGDKRRTVPLSDLAIEAARHLLEEHGGELWPWRPRHVNRVWKRERERLELATDITPHTFRHDFASWLVNQERLPLPDVQQILGHENLTTTAQYLHPDGRRVGAAVAGRGASMARQWYQGREKPGAAGMSE